MKRLWTLREQLVGLSGELQGGSRRRLLTRSRMSKRNFERKLTIHPANRRSDFKATTDIGNEKIPGLLKPEIPSRSCDGALN
jgi:hypothetical protein